MNFLPGWFPAGAAATGRGTIAQVLSATAAATTIVVPTGVLAGDLLVLLDGSGGIFFAPTSVVPAGFTSISDITVGKGRQIVSYKLALGTEGGTTLTGMTSDAATALKELYVFRKTPAATLLTVSTPNAQATTGNPTPQNVLASAGLAPLVVLGCYGSNGMIDPRTFTPTKDGEINASTFGYLAYKIYNQAPENVTVDMELEDAVANFLQSFYIEMA
jgi:hypothetical protein